MFRIDVSILLATFICCFAHAEALTCYSCTNVTLMSNCHTSVDCGSDESCFTDLQHTTQGNLYTLGCRSDKQCPVQANVGIVGRALAPHTAGTCQECCSNTRCSKKLCSTDDTCSDSMDINCETTNAIFDICADTEHAVTVCRKYCGLCDRLNGKWTPWEAWGLCDVTCGSGIQTRTRTCTDPAPAGGGSPCSGSNTDTKQCTLEVCPTHGAWSLWSSWGSCSVTCGTGMQRRDRSCSNPFPSRFGDHCFGDARDDRICIPGACANGGWSSWSTWSSCGVTCGGGIRSRDRACNNPLPSPQGQYCPGRSYESSMCSTSRCPDIISAFTVTQPYSVVSSVLTFSKTIFNQGGDFNPSTGLFTCTKPGVYYFTVSLIKKRSSDRVDQIYCYLYQNDSSKLHIQVDPVDDDTDKGSTQASNFALLHLARGDIVKLYGCSSPPSTFMEPWTTFSGFLVYPDV